MQRNCIVEVPSMEGLDTGLMWHRTMYALQGGALALLPGKPFCYDLAPLVGHE